MNNDWTDRLRDRMADYEMPVGDELWANIEQSLAQNEVFANKNDHSNHDGSCGLREAEYAPSIF